MALKEPEGAIVATLGELQLFVGFDELVVAGPGPCPEANEIGPIPSAIRERVRFDDTGRYRPLSGLRNMPSDWHARFATLEAFAAGIEAIYPLAQEHAALHADGNLAVTTLDEVFARQQGRYAIASTLSPRGRALAERALCGSCVRDPVWNGVNHVGEGGIPCPEPCSVLLSLCREMAVWEVDAPALSQPEPSIPFAAFDQPGNQLREACLRALEQPRG